MTERHFNDDLKCLVIEQAMHHYNKAANTCGPSLLQENEKAIQTKKRVSTTPMTRKKTQNEKICVQADIRTIQRANKGEFV